MLGYLGRVSYTIFLFTLTVCTLKIHKIMIIRSKNDCNRFDILASSAFLLSVHEYAARSRVRLSRLDRPIHIAPHLQQARRSRAFAGRREKKKSNVNFNIKHTHSSTFIFYLYLHSEVKYVYTTDVLYFYIIFIIYITHGVKSGTISEISCFLFSSCSCQGYLIKYFCSCTSKT